MKRRLEILVNLFFRLNSALPLLILLMGANCTRPQAKPRPIPFSSKPGSVTEIRRPAKNRVSVVQSSDKERIDALLLVQQADKAYADGDYAEAEQLLKKSISLYPFLPPRLTIQKLLLLK